VEALRVKDVVGRSVSTVNSSMSYGSAQTMSILELRRIHSQGFSDSTEIAELRNDLTQVPQALEVVISTVRSLMLKVLWRSIKPKGVLTLRPGEVRKIGDNLLVEKTSDGRIILYEVVE